MFRLASSTPSALTGCTFGTRECRERPIARYDRGHGLRREEAAAGGSRVRRGSLDRPTLLARIASGDQSATRECMDRYGGLVWSLARRLLGTHSEAEDALHEVFIEVWKNAWKYDPTVASETAFITMLARRRIIDRRRRLDRRHDREQLPETAPASGSEPSRNLGTSEDAKAAAVALEELSDEQKRCLRLSVYEGLTHDRIAASTGLPLGTVKTHVRRGLMKIRALLGGEKGREIAAGAVAREVRP